MTTLRYTIGCLAVLLVLQMAVGQELGRPAQLGTKSTEPTVAVAVQVPVPLDDMGRSAELLGQAADDLTSMAVAEGLTLVGPMHIVTQNMAQAVDGQMTFELRLLIAEQPTEADLAADYGFSLVVSAPQKVAFTYHRGPLAELQSTTMDLIQWVMQSGLQMAGGPEFVMYSVPELEELQVAEVRVPVQ